MSQKNNKKRKSMQSHVKQELLENKICETVGRKLSELYHGWAWFVECKMESGVVTVKNLSLHGDYGFVIHLSQLVNDPDLKTVVIAGGELLERCGLPRGPRPEGINMTLDKDRDGRGNLKVIDNYGAEKK